MLKNQLPLQPNNPKIIEKPGKFLEKPKNNEEKTINTDVWDCDEDIQVIDFPISTFTNREPFQQLPIEVESTLN